MVDVVGVAGLGREVGWTSLMHPAPNQALEPTPYSLRFAPAFGRGSPRAFGACGGEETNYKQTQWLPLC